MQAWYVLIMFDTGYKYYNKQQYVAVKVLKSDATKETVPPEANDDLSRLNSVLQIQEREFKEDQDLKYNHWKRIKYTSHTLSLVATINTKKPLITPLFATINYINYTTIVKCAAL